MITAIDPKYLIVKEKLKINIQVVIVLYLIKQSVLITNYTVTIGVLTPMVTWFKVKTDQSVTFPQSSEIVPKQITKIVCTEEECKLENLSEIS